MSLNIKAVRDVEEIDAMPQDIEPANLLVHPVAPRAAAIAHCCSVVIVSFKTGPVLLDCLRSLLHEVSVRQVILVNNGNTRTLMQSVEELADSDPRVEIVTGHGNVGFSKGCNLGAARASEDFLLLLNPDCVFHPNVLSRALAVFDEETDASLVTVRLQNPDGSEQRGGRRNLLTPWTCLVEQFRLDRLAPNHPHFKRLNLNEAEPFEGITQVQCISGAFMLMPKSVFFEHDGMDEDYFLHVEDIDFCMKLAKAEKTILYIPDLTVTHVQGTSRVFPAIVEWHKAVSVVRYFHKHFQPQYPRPLLKIIAAAIFIRFAMRLLPMTIGWIFGLMGGRRSDRRTTGAQAAANARSDAQQKIV